MSAETRRSVGRWLPWLAVCAVVLYLASPSFTRQRRDVKEKDAPPASSSYDQISPVLLGQESYESMRAKDKEAKAGIMARQKKLLEERYNLEANVDPEVKMTRGKPIPVGPVTRLPEGQTWDALAKMSPEDIKAKGVFPKGFLPLPHPNHPAGGMLFPAFEIKQQARLERFDLDFDLPDHFMPEFPPAIFLTTRPDLGDISRGQMLNVDNFQEIFQGILNAKDLEGVRLLVSQFPQQQFNATADRKTEKPDGMKG